MTTGGEGGMITTNNEDIWSKVWSLKDHGKSWQSVFARQHPPGFRWLHDSFGGNARMLEAQAAIGRVQLRKMAEWTDTRQRHAKRLWSTAKTIPSLRVPEPADWAHHAAYKAYVFVDPSKLAAGWDRDRVMAEINKRGVPCFSGSCSEIYLEKAFEAERLRPSTRCAVAKELGETSLMFLCHPTIRSEHMDQACSALEDVMRLATK